MKRFDSLNIRHKLILIILMVSLFVVTLVGGARIAWDVYESRNGLAKDLTAVTRLLSDRSSAALAFNDTRLAKENLTSLESLQHVLQACVYRNDGTLLADYSRKNILLRCLEINEIKESKQYFDNNKFHITYRISQGTQSLGWIYLNSDLSLIEARLNNQLAFSFLALLVAVILTVILAGRVQRIISGPIENITQIAKMIEAQGDHSLRTKADGNDEVGQLARSFNAMLDAVQTKSKELVAAKDEQIEASALYRNLITSTSAIPWELDLDTWRFTYVGQQAISLLGYPVEDWYKENFWVEHLHPDDRDKSIAYCQTSTEEKRDHEFEYRMFSSDGRCVWIHDDVQVIVEYGKPVRLQGFMFDISERKRQEEAIKNIAIGVSGQTGTVFYEQLILHLSKLFGADYVFIGLIDNETKKSINTLVVSARGKIVENISYSLIDTPCATVVGHTTCIYSDNVQNLFPNDQLLIDMGVESYVGSPMFSTSGEALGLIVILDSKPIKNAENISEIIKIFSARTAAEIERSRSDKKLYDTQQKLALHVQQTPLGVIEWNTQFEVVDWNPAAEQIFGYTREEAIGKNREELVLSQVISEENNITWQSLLNNTGGQRSRNENITKEGKHIICEWYNTSLVTDDGKVIGVASLVSDITKEQETQLILEGKEVEQREILNSMFDAVISIDETGKILTFNKSAEILFGYSVNELLGENVKVLMPEPFSTKYDKYLQLYLNTGKENFLGHTGEVNGLRKDQSIFEMSLSVAQLPDDERGNRRFIGSCHDLTEHNMKEEQLRRSQKMDALGKLTGGVAHDYNNMLGVILGYSELLESMLTDKPELASYANAINHAGKRGAKLTKKLLSFSRSKASDAEVVNLNDLLKDEQHMLEKTLTARIRLELKFDADVWPIWVDSSDLEDAILNMCINAMHAMENSGQLTIQTLNTHADSIDSEHQDTDQKDYVLLSITDTGCGMDNETIGKIFDPFYSTKGDKGTGLGLSQVYGFVNSSGGKIKVSSEFNHGTRISIYFPRYFKGISKEKTIKDDSLLNLQNSESILLVDDELSLLNMTSTVLSLQGYKVFKALSAKEALKVLETESIDLLLSDIVMPVMDGYELVAIVQEKYPNIKIQLATGFDDGQHANMVNKNLHNQVLQKPYNRQILLKRIHDILN